jgi:hypothetical protein
MVDLRGSTRRCHMKFNLSRLMLFAVGALLLGSAALAQEINVQAKVPFDFMLGGKLYPAGQYSVQNVIPDHQMLRLRNKTSLRAVFIPYQPASSPVPAERTQLVFHRLGNTYFLRQVQVAGSTLGREFLRSHVETEMALNATDKGTVNVAGYLTY